MLADAAAAKSNAAAAAAPAGAVELRANRVDVAGGAAARQSQAAAALAAPVAPRAQGLALEKTTRLRPLCFEQRQPLDSAGRIIRLEAGALEDSIRLEKLTRHGDTLAAVNGPLIAILSRCPAP